MQREFRLEVIRMTTETIQSPETNCALPRMTYQEFLDWADEDVHAEWVDGEVVPKTTENASHQQLVALLAAAMSTHVQSHDLGEVLSAPFQIKLATRPSGREPDILFVARENLGRLHETFLDGPADLAIEIISPQSRARDRGDKFYEYEAGGVREYWLIDTQSRRAEWHQLGSDGIYQKIASDEHGVYRSRELSGLWIDQAWLWQKPLPPLLDVLRIWKLI